MEQEKLEDFVNDVKALDIEHQLSSRVISNVRESLARYRKTIGQCEAIQKLGSSILTERLTKYLQAGGWHEDTARSVGSELCQGLTELRESTQNARLRVERLKNAASSFSTKLEDVSTELTVELRTLVLSTPPPASSYGDEMVSNMEALGRDTEENRLQYAFHMAVICQMLQDDMDMKERIVGALGLDTTAEHMDVYSATWALRPFVADEIMETALTGLHPKGISHES